MTRRLPVFFVMSTLVLIGCGGGNAPKSDGGKPETKVEQESARKEPPVTKENKSAVKTENDQKPKKVEEVKNEPKPVSRKADFEVSLAALVQEFAGDGNAALKKYQGKVVEFTEQVSGITEGNVHFSVLVKRAKNETRLISVLCNALPEETDKAMRFSEKQKVKAQGKVAAWINNEILSLTDSSFMALEPSTLTAFTAADLAKEVERDIDAASAKFGKGFLLTGTVEELTMDKNIFGLGIAKMKGSEKTRIAIGIANDDKFRTIKKGQTIELRGWSIQRTDKNEISLSGILLKTK